LLKKRGELLVIVAIFLVLSILISSAVNADYTGCCDTGTAYKTNDDDGNAYTDISCEDVDGTAGNWLTPGEWPEDKCVPQYKECCCYDIPVLATQLECTTADGVISDVIDISDCNTECQVLDSCSNAHPTISNIESCGGAVTTDCKCGAATASAIDSDYCCSIQNFVGIYYDDCILQCPLAPGTGTLRGIVTDDSNVALDGVDVLVEGHSAITNENGAYTIVGIISGFSKIVTATRQAFESFSDVTNINEGDNVFDFQMTAFDDVCGNRKFEPGAGEECDTYDTECLTPIGISGMCSDQCECVARTLPPGQETTTEDCNTDEDDDNDGSVNECDSDCWGSFNYPVNPVRQITYDEIKATETGFCGDRLDNDCDGLLDDDDDDCPKEDDQAPAAGYTDPCADYTDNDADGRIDVCDKDCPNYVLADTFDFTKLPDETQYAYDALAQNESADDFGQHKGETLASNFCGDDVDNDCDGLIDGDDPECVIPAFEDICYNDFDDDQKSNHDCLDPYCFGDNPQQEHYVCVLGDQISTTCTTQYAFDSDEDGLVDRCCPEDLLYDCNLDDGFGVPDSCSPCDEEICTNDYVDNNGALEFLDIDDDDSGGAGCNDDACDGLECWSDNPNFRCIDNVCQERTGVLLTGNITECGAEPENLIKGVLLELDGPGNLPTRTVYSNDAGRYVYYNVMPASSGIDADYTITANVFGYQQKSVDLVIYDDTVKNICLNSLQKFKLTGYVRYENESGEFVPVAGADVLVHGGIYKNITDENGFYIISGIVQGSHNTEAKKMGFTRVSETLDFTANVKHNFTLEKIPCGRYRPVPELLVAQPIKTQPLVNLTWEYSCPPVNITVHRCTDSGAYNDNRKCDTEFIPIKFLGTDIFTYIDEVEPDKEYCYNVSMKYDDELSVEIKHSNTICVGPFDKQCFETTNEFCFDNARYTCTDLNQKTAIDGGNCNDFYGGNAVCLGPTKENGETFCSYQSNCKDCGKPFGLFASPAPDGEDINYLIGTEGEDRLCEQIPTCYFDYTETSVDEYQKCTDVGSCYDYKGQKACTQSLSLNSDGTEDGSFNNRCLNRNCTWVSDPRYDELGIGVCRETDEQDWDCSLCQDDVFRFNDVYGICDKTRCSLYGSCYCDNIDEDGVCETCKHRDETSCETYDAFDDCTGETQLNINVAWQTYDIEPVKDSGNNSILDQSDDYLGIGVCIYSDNCYKDADFSQDADCVDNDEACQFDQYPPSSHIDSPRLICFGANCTIEPKITVHVVDQEPIYEDEPRIIWYGVKKENSNIDGFPLDYDIVYPNTMMDGNVFDLEFTEEVIDNEEGSGNYTVYLFTEDGSKNLEHPIKYFRLRVDTIAPMINFSVVDNFPYEITYSSDDVQWLTNITFQINTTNEKAFCSTYLRSYASNTPIQPENSIKPEENSHGNFWTRSYTELADGSYFYEISCMDVAGNQNNLSYYVRIAADDRVSNPLPHDTLNYRDVTISVDTIKDVGCRYTDNLSIKKFEDISLDNLMHKNTVTLPNYPDLIDKYFHEHTFNNLEQNLTYEYKVICNYTGNPYEVVSFTIDLAAPVTSALNFTEDTPYKFDEWKSRHVLRLACNDLIMPTKNGSIDHHESLGKFGCNVTLYCINFTSTQECNPDILVPNNDVITIEHYDRVNLCYYSADFGNNIETKKCDVVYVDNQRPIINITVYKDYGNDIETKLMLRKQEYTLLLEASETLADVDLKYRYFKKVLGVFPEASILNISPIDAENTTWIAKFNLSNDPRFDNIEYEVNNTEFILVAHDDHGMEATQDDIVEIKKFSIDTAGPGMPEIKYPLNLYPDFHSEPANSIFVVGYENSRSAVGYQLKVWVTNVSLDSREGSETTGINNWTFVTTTTKSSNDMVRNIPLIEYDAEAGSNKIVVTGDFTGLEQLKNQYVEFSNHILVNQTYYKITDLVLSGMSNTEIHFTPPLAKKVTTNAVLKIYDSLYPTGWWGVDVPLIEGYNWFYAVEVDDNGNEGIKNGNHLIIADPSVPEISIDEPDAIVSASPPARILAKIKDNLTAVYKDSIKLVINASYPEGPTISNTFTCQDSVVNCQEKDGIKEIHMIYNPNDWDYARYEFFISATNLVGGEAQAISWYDYAENAPHNPYIEFSPEDGIRIEDMSYTNKVHPIMNISFEKDIGTQVNITQINLTDQNNNPVPIKSFTKIVHDLNLAESSSYTINTFEPGNKDKINITFIGHETNTDIKIKIHKDAVVTKAIVNMTGFVSDLGSFPADINLQIGLNSHPYTGPYIISQELDITNSIQLAKNCLSLLHYLSLLL